MSSAKGSHNTVGYYGHTDLSTDRDTRGDNERKDDKPVVPPADNVSDAFPVPSGTSYEMSRAR